MLLKMAEWLTCLITEHDNLRFYIFIIDNYADISFWDEESTLSTHYPGKSQLFWPIPIKLITILNRLKETFNPLA